MAAFEIVSSRDLGMWGGEQRRGFDEEGNEYEALCTPEPQR